jgi:hypothetical protein
MFNKIFKPNIVLLISVIILLCIILSHLIDFIKQYSLCLLPDLATGMLMKMLFIGRNIPIIFEEIPEANWPLSISSSENFPMGTNSLLLRTPSHFAVVLWRLTQSREQLTTPQAGHRYLPRSSEQTWQRPSLKLFSYNVSKYYSNIDCVRIPQYVKQYDMLPKK